MTHSTHVDIIKSKVVINMDIYEKLLSKIFPGKKIMLTLYGARLLGRNDTSCFHANEAYR